MSKKGCSKKAQKPPALQDSSSDDADPVPGPSGLHQDKIDELEKSLNQLRIENDELRRENAELRPTFAPYTDDPKLHNWFIVFDKNDSKQNYRYHTIRVQRRNLLRALNEIRAKYPNGQIIFQKERDPNSVKLFNLIEESSQLFKITRRRGNDFNTDLSVVELRSRISNFYERLRQGRTEEKNSSDSDGENPNNNAPEE